MKRTTDTDSRRYRFSEDVIARRMGEKTVLVHLGTNQVYTLNRTGTRLWELIGEGLDPEQIEGKLVEEFEVEPGRLAAELEERLSTLVEAELLTLGEDD